MHRMKKFLFFLQLIAVIALSSCTDDPLPDPNTNGNANEVDNTIIVYMPWSGDPYSLYDYFKTNLRDMKQAIVNEGGLGNKRLVVFISEAPEKGALINVKYQSGQCVDDTLAKFDNTQPNQQLNTSRWITNLLTRVKAYAPAHNYSMIVGCHGMGWIPSYAGTRTSVSNTLQKRWRDVESKPLTRWFGGDTYKTDISILDRGIAQSGIGKMQYILFDDCYMSTIEVAYELRHSAHYLIGCPTEIMAHGMPYEQLWNELSKSNPNYQNVVDEFYNFYSSYSSPYGTISVIDCSQAEGMVNIMRQINQSSNLVLVPPTSIQQMDGYNPSIFFDMGDYVEKRAVNEPILLSQFRNQLNLLVPYKRHTPSYFSAVTSSSGTVYPINTYSGITISDPSVNTKVTSAFAASPYYRATH